jgi:hypothetical protein
MACFYASSAIEISATKICGPGPLIIASRGFGFRLVWYGMLWSVIEATIDASR